MSESFTFKKINNPDSYQKTEEFRIINESDNPDPSYKTEGSSGMDIMAYLEDKEPVIIKPGERSLIPTGLYIELPNCHEAQIRPRSGLALKHGITVLNSPGTVDSDYRGEIKVLLINLSKEDFKINSGDRIAQMVISKFLKVTFSEAETLSETARGEGGYGHTGI